MFIKMHFIYLISLQKLAFFPSLVLRNCFALYGGNLFVRITESTPYSKYIFKKVKASNFVTSSDRVDIIDFKTLYMMYIQILIYYYILETARLNSYQDFS